MALYHFTKFGSLLGILRSHLLFLSDLSFSNDRGEGEFQREIICEAIREWTEDAGLRDNLIRAFSSGTADGKFLSLYSLSLTPKLNSSFNWMLYGDYGSGAALAFNEEKLEKLLQQNRKDFVPPYRKVMYHPRDYQKELSIILDRHMHDEMVVDCAVELQKIYPFIKSSAFEGERERRIAFVSHDMVSTLSAEDGLLFYYDGDFQKFALNFDCLIKEGAIASIILGCNVTLYEKRLVQNALPASGYKLKVKESRVPVRPKKE
jgi:hypothetical protein